MSIKSLSRLSFIAIMGLVIAGCSSKEKKSSLSDTNVADTPDVNLELNGSSDEGSAGPLQTVYFAYDSSSLSDSSREMLDENAMFLKTASNVDIQIEGHCDERGGAQYNLALGERRAKAVRDYLIAMGVDQARVSLISYGKEKPVSYGHDESAWSRNRRANFVITAK